jgi:hypothetical protein
MAELLTVLPRSDIVFEAISLPILPTLNWTSQLISSEGIAEIWLQVYSNNSSDGAMFVRVFEYTVSESFTNPGQTNIYGDLPVTNVGPDALIGGSYYFVSAKLPLTSGQFQLLIAYNGTSEDFSVNVSIRAVRRH